MPHPSLEVPMSRLQNVRRVRLSVNTLEDRTTPAGFDHVYHVTDGATLAAAVQTADTQTGASEIVLDRMGTYNVPATLPITADITITGRSLYHPASYIIQPASGVQDRGIDLTTNNTLVLQNLTIQGGTTTGNGGGVEVT